MRFSSVEKLDKTGSRIVLRNPEIADVLDLIDYLRVTSGETRFLLRDPDEIAITPELEGQFLHSRLEAEGEWMILAIAEGKLAGSCTVMRAEPHRRAAHRCEIGIALYREYWGRGIGKLMMEQALLLAKEYGYEQAELEVSTENEAAIGLYKNLGFEVYGRLPHNMKYRDGTYADMLWMMKRL